MVSRRQFLGGALGAMACARASWSRGRTLADDRSLITVILRGGVDALAMMPPTGDPDYSRYRGAPPSSLRTLDSRFGLHGALSFVHQCHLRGQLAVFPAIALPYRGRSHFDAQQMLDSGGSRPYQMSDGWLARALGPLNAAYAASSVVPLPLQGSSNVLTFSRRRIGHVPIELFEPLRKLYQQTWLEEELENAVRQHAHQPENESPFSATGKVLAERKADVACIEMGGFDTHENQEQTLNRQFVALNQGMQDLYSTMGKRWDKAVVLVYSEFGRRVEVNATGGTDHGTGGVLLALGGAVSPGVFGEWPGLGASDLLENRDLRPTMDFRDVFATVLRDHADLPRGRVRAVFNRNYHSVKGLISS